MNPEELEQYEIAIEEQAYPFEEKAIAVHESNLKLISRGVYNEWVDKSLQKLAVFVPARYDKPEETSGIVTSLESYVFEIDRPAASVLPQSVAGATADGRSAAPVQADAPQSAGAKQTAQTVQADDAKSVQEAQSAAPARDDAPGAEADKQAAQNGSDQGGFQGTVQ